MEKLRQKSRLARDHPRGQSIEALEPRRMLTSAPLAPQTVGTSFLGAHSADSGFVPPDSVGDVGPAQVLVIVNGRVRVFDKNGVLGGLNETTNTFFNSVRNNSTTSDPHVRYDRLTGRWFITMINVTSPTNRVLIAVSSGPTITSHSSFSFFQFQQDSVGTMPNTDTGHFADYDTLGVDKFALYIGVNEFSGNTFVGTTGFVVNKASLVAGTLSVTPFRGMGTSSASSMYTPQGVDNDDPNATEGYFIGTKDNTSTSTILTIRRVSNPGGTPTLSSTINITVPTQADPISQVAKGSNHPLDAIDNRLFSAQITRNQLTGALSLWTANNIQVNSSGAGSTSGGRNGSRWYEITNLTSTPTLAQSGTLFDSSSSSPLGYWIPSVAANGQGTMAIAASVAGTNMFPSIAVAGRLFTDPSGTLQAPTVALTSSTSYNAQSGVTTQRWGDFSQTVVDPTDDMTMWTFQEYCDATNSWGVRAIKLIALPPATPSGSNVTSINAGATSVSVVITGTSASGSGFFDPGPDTGGPGFANHISAAVNGGGVTVNSVVFTDPTHIMLNLTVASDASGGLRTITVINPDGQTATSATGLITIIGATGSIAGRVYQDNNGNGVFDSATEPFMNGVTVFLDTDNSGTLNGSEPSVITSGSGDFSFTSLPDGTYNVREIVPDGFIATPPVVLTPTISGGGAVVNQDLGNFPVVFSGGSSNDSYTISLNAAGTIEQINDGVTTYTIDKSLLTTLTFNGNAGDDTLTVNAANGSPVPSGGVAFDGGANATSAGDAIALVGGAGDDSASFDSDSITFGGTIDSSSVDRFSFDGAGGNDSLTVNAGTVNVPATQVLQSLTVAVGASLMLSPGANKVIKTSSLSLGGTIDLADNAMIVEYSGASPLASVLALINSGRAVDGSGKSTWSGQGIVSSVAAGDPLHTAIGAIDNSSLDPGAYSTFFSQPVDQTSVLVRYTANGDANLDGTVNTSDFIALATNFNTVAQTWGGGDFNFDGSVNALDFNTLATNFGTALPRPAPPVSASLFSDQTIASRTTDLI